MSSNSRSSSVEAMYRRRPSFTRPPIRGVNSPRLTDEEADQLTSPFLNYSTGYTYAFSQAYNPDKPPSWEVPNMGNNVMHIGSPEYVPYHFSAPSIMYKVGQKVISVVSTLLNALFWLLYLVTVRLFITIGLLWYITIVYTIRTVGEYVSVCLYNASSDYVNSLRSCSSMREVLSVTFSMLLHIIFGILRFPVDLTIRAFCKFRAALRRSYYARLDEKSRLINRRAVLSKLEEVRRREAEAVRFLEDVRVRKLSRLRGEHVDYGGSHFRRYGDDNNRYNLRRRVMTADTDSDDDIPWRRKSVHFAPSTRMLRSDEISQSHGTYRIATWLGSAASSFVYYMLYMVHMLIVSVKKSYCSIKTALSYFVPPILSSSTAHPSKFLRSRADGHTAVISKEAHLSKRTSFGKKSSGQRVSPIVAQWKSLCFSILYTPSRAFLFIVFAGADLFRWIYSRTCIVFGWLRDVFWNIATVLVSRRHRWVWWLLPFLILFLFFYRGTNDRMTILGHDVYKLQEQVSNYAHSLVDPDEVYAKSLNSIYDEYWRSGKLSGYSIISRITAAASNSYLFVVTVFKTTFSLIYTSAVGFFTSLELYLYNSLTLLNNLGTMMMSGLSNLFSMLSNCVSALFILITSSFHGLSVDMVDQHKKELKQNPTMDVVHTDINPNGCVQSFVPSIDEVKLIDKVSAVVRAKMDQDFKAKFENELKALSATYDEKLSRLELDKNRIGIDYARLESIIRTAILEYDSDKTGMFDFALESAGAAIISTRCSENYNTYSRLEKIWNIPLWYSSYGPRTVIQRNSKTLFPGECWSFKGPVGYITIGLSHEINVTLISYEHIGAHQAPDGHRPSAPKTFKIWAYKSEDDMNTRVLLGDFMYDLKGNPLQFFVVKTQPDYPVKIIEMEVTSNYGAEYTSLYRLRVHGSLYKSGNL